MPTYILDEAREVRLPRGAVTVQLQATGVPAGQVHLQAIRDGQEVPAALRPAPGLLVLPDVPDGTVLRVVPVAPQRTFAPSAAVSLSLSTARSSDPDPSRAVVTLVDIAGLSERDLVALGRDAEGLTVTRLGGVSDHGDGAALSDLAQRARVAARELLGVDRVPAASAVALTIAVDQSASMRPAVQDGSVRAVADVVVGLSRVVSPGRPVRARLLTSPPAGPDDVEPARLAETLAARAAETPVRLGFRSADPALGTPAAEPGTVTYVVTDAVPADLDDEPGADGADRRHLVLLTAASAWEARDVTPRLPVTVVPVPGSAGGAPPEWSFSGPGELHDLVRSLLVGCFDPGTALAERVSR